MFTSREPKMSKPRSEHTGQYLPEGGQPLDPRRAELRLPTEAMSRFISIAEQRGVKRGELLRQIVIEWLAGEG